jgi:DNA repair exonuclease SbcCD ATPase subunit
MQELVKELRHEFIALDARRRTLSDKLNEGREDELRLNALYGSTRKMRAVTQEVAEQTLNNLSYQVSSIVTSALASVWPDPFGFDVEFRQARNQIECHLWFIKNGHRIEPMESSGGGALDVASFALRITYWSLLPNPTRPTFLLDEPFKYVSEDLQEACSQMVKMLSEKMGVQVIMVSHLPNINSSADKEYKVRLSGDVSKVKEVKRWANLASSAKKGIPK